MLKPYFLIFIILLVFPTFLHAQTWKPLGPDESNTPSPFWSVYTDITISSDNVPYIVYNGGAEGKLTIKKLENNKWVVVGNPEFTEGRSSYSSISFAPDGTLYVLYNYFVISEQFSFLQVRKLVGDKWIKVGENPAVGGGCSITFDPKGVPYIVYQEYYRGGVKVRKFTNGSWELVGTDGDTSISGSPTTSISYYYTTHVHGQKMFIAPDGVAYVVYSALNDDFRATVKRFVNGQWQNVGSPAFTNPGASQVTISVTPAGSIYVAYQDSVNNRKVTVQQYKSGVWEIAGSPGISTGAAEYIDLVLGPDQTPYLQYKDKGLKGKVVVKNFNRGSWNDVGKEVSVKGAKEALIRADNKGGLYSSYTDSTMYSKLTIKKLSGNDWVLQGREGITTGRTNGLAVTNSSDGTAYVAFNDEEYEGKVSVKKYASGKWEYVGARGISPDDKTNYDITTANGTLYVFLNYYNPTDGYQHLSVKKLNGKNWEDLPEPKRGFAYNRLKIVAAPDGSIHIAFNDWRTGGTLTVQKYINGQWVDVGNNPISRGGVNDISLAFDNRGVAYVSYVDLSLDKTLCIKKLVNNEWIDINGKVLSYVKGYYSDLKISPDGTPYFVWSAGKMYLKKYVNDEWVSLTDASLDDVIGYLPQMAFDKNGSLYLYYNDDSFTDHKVVKMVNDKWVNISSPKSKEWYSKIEIFTLDANGQPMYFYVGDQAFARILNSDDQAATPVIKSCTPNLITTGSVITINGFNFNSTTSVKIGNSAVASFKVISATQIVATVGTGSTGPVTVSTSFGSTSYGNLVYSAPPPVITSFSPSFGNVGTIVNIFGKNFGKGITNNRVFFGIIEAKVIEADNDLLSVEVPPYASSSPISVTTSSLTAYSPNTFNLTFDSRSDFDANSFALRKDYPLSDAGLSLTATDIDNNGRPDIVIESGGKNIYLNNSSKRNIVLNNAHHIVFGSDGIAVRDLDGDGKQDYIAPNTTKTVSVLKNLTQGGNISFNGVANYRLLGDRNIYNVASTDVDGDGRPDVICSDFFTNILRNSGTQEDYVFLEDLYQVNKSSLLIGGFVVNDVDGDGKPDIMILQQYGYLLDSVHIYKNNSAPGVISFTKAAQFAVGVNASALKVADFNNDGKPDVLILNPKSNKFTVFKNTSTNTLQFTPGVEIETGNLPQSVCITDLNGDGMADVAIVARGDNDYSLSVYKNTSNTTDINFSPRVIYQTSGGGYDVIANDLDGDGAPDLIVSNLFTHSFSVFRNNMIRIKIPPTNYKVAVTSAACPGSETGNIKIKADQTLNYQVTVKGNSLNKVYSFTDSVVINKLVAGTYNICISAAEVSGSNQCYDLVVSEPEKLALSAALNDDLSHVNLSLKGAHAYNININGTQYSTTDNYISLPVTTGDNIISVSTDVSCQGVIEKLIHVLPQITPYPVPFTSSLSLNIGIENVNSLNIRLYNATTGKMVYSKNYTNVSNVLTIDTSSLHESTYVLKFILKGQERVFKVIKKQQY